MTHRIMILAVFACVFSVSIGQAQVPSAKPGPEHEILKEMVGNWETTMKFEGMEVKGTCVYKMDLGGLWVSSTFESEIFGTKFVGKGYDTYDANKKKYVGIWLDSMSSTPLIMEGDFDKTSKTLTMTGTGTGMDGMPVKMKAVTVLTDSDNMHFKMFEGDKKEPSFTIHYKRKK